jgi:hypothetical protein
MYLTLKKFGTRGNGKAEKYSTYIGTVSICTDGNLKTTMYGDILLRAKINF